MLPRFRTFITAFTLASVAMSAAAQADDVGFVVSEKSDRVIKVTYFDAGTAMKSKPSYRVEVCDKQTRTHCSPIIYGHNVVSAESRLISTALANKGEYTCGLGTAGAGMTSFMAWLAGATKTSRYALGAAGVLAACTYWREQVGKQLDRANEALASTTETHGKDFTVPDLDKTINDIEYLLDNSYSTHGTLTRPKLPPNVDPAPSEASGESGVAS